ncbi:hypothetical protein FRC06_003992 [Ceratobasidium sp. 370]|nr:hypothetical protein FRC06_003992 [Ceratobasidium sp. 370]
MSHTLEQDFVPDYEPEDELFEEETSPQFQVEDLPQDQKEHMAKVDPKSAESVEAKVLKLNARNNSLEELSYEV